MIRKRLCDMFDFLRVNAPLVSHYFVSLVSLFFALSSFRFFFRSTSPTRFPRRYFSFLCILSSPLTPLNFFPSPRYFLCSYFLPPLPLLSMFVISFRRLLFSLANFLPPLVFPSVSFDFISSLLSRFQPLIKRK